MSACRALVEAATIDRFAFDVELLYMARLARLRLREIAVRWDHNDGSKVSVLRDSFRMLGEVRSIRQGGLADRWHLESSKAKSCAAIPLEERELRRSAQKR